MQDDHVVRQRAGMTAARRARLMAIHLRIALGSVLLACGSASSEGASVARGGSGALTVTRAVVAPTPPESVTTIALRITRLTQERGEATVSSGIPLPPGVLKAEQLPWVRLVVQGQEQPAYFEVLRGVRRDGSLRTLLVRFRFSIAPGENVPANLIIGERRTREMSADPPGERSIPDAMILPTRAEYLVSTEIVGPTTPLVQTRSLGGPFARYDADFARYADLHWTRNADRWEDNYYDRALAYYAQWARTANPEYFRRATLQAVSYRRGYLEANNYGSSPHWSQLEGLELHYLLTGDEASRYAIARTVETGLNSFFARGELRDTRVPYMENRIQARVLLGFLSAWRVQARGDRMGPADWSRQLPQALDQILSTERDDGSYAWSQICGQQLNYMVGMLNDVLIEYHHDFRPDPRIPEAIKRSLDYLWNTQWLPKQQAFQYQSGSCASNGGSPFPAGDLNGLLLNGFAWMYHETGDQTYRSRADAIFAGMVNNDALTGGVHLNGSKQFNQQYSISYRYFRWREGR